MWKWEDENDEFLMINCQLVQDQGVGSSSTGRTIARHEKRGGSREKMKHLGSGGSSEIEMHLKEIVWLLKAVIFVLVVLVFLLFLFVRKHMDVSDGCVLVCDVVQLVSLLFMFEL